MKILCLRNILMIITVLGKKTMMTMTSAHTPFMLLLIISLNRLAFSVLSALTFVKSALRKAEIIHPIHL